MTAKENKTNFLSNLFLLNLLNLMIKPIWLLVVDREVQLILGPHEYGMFYRAFNFVFLFNILLDLGINNYTSKEQASNANFVPLHLKTMVYAKVLLAVVFFVLVTIISKQLGHNTQLRSILYLLAGYQIVLGFFQFFRSILVGYQEYGTDVVFSVLEKGLLIFTLFIIFLNPNFAQKLSAQNYAKIHLVVIVLACFVLVLYGTKKIGLSAKKSNKSILSFTEILKKTFPFALLGILMNLYTRLDVFMIGQIIPQSEFWIAQYVKGFRLLDALNMVAALSAGFLLPLFSKFKHNINWVQHNTTVFFEMFLWLVLPTVIFGFFHKAQIITFLYGSEEWQIAAKSFGILIWVFLAMSGVYVFGTMLTAMGKLKQMNLMAGITLIFNFFLNLHFIPKQGIVGAAKVTLLSQAIFALFCIYQVWRISRLKWNVLKIRNMILLLIFLISIAYLFDLQSKSLLLSIGVETVVYFLLSIPLGLVPKKETFLDIDKH